jgi:hypothetical protein
VEKATRGLTWTASEEETIEALDISSRFFLPLASHVQQDEPNVAVILNEPVELTNLRRKAISSSNLFVRRLCDVERAPGFLVRLKDPDAAANAFATKGLLRKLDGGRASLIEPLDEDVKRYRRWRVRTSLAKIISVLLFARLVWVFLDNFAR